MEDPFNIIKTHDIDKMKTLLDNGVNVNKKKLFGSTLIEEAMANGVFNMAMILYQYNADIKKVKNMYNDVIFCEDENEIANVLYERTVHAIKEFSKDHKMSKIYVFGYEYRYEYGSILISLNCEEGFKETLKHYQENYPESYNDKESIEGLKYNPGDWSFQDFKSFTILTKENEQKYTETLKKVLNKLNDEKVFDDLNKSDNFSYDIYEYD